MGLLEPFLDPAAVSLKICGVTRRDDAWQLAALGVAAMGVNFWPQSPRYVTPPAAAWLHDLAGRILRVGVFVNQPAGLPLSLVTAGLLDVVQLHGEESPAEVAIYQQAGVPVFKAFGVRSAADLSHATDFGSCAILLDAHAPDVRGGTGQTFDWNTAIDFKNRHPQVPLILAGGIAPANAALAATTVRPAAVDVASGAELAPGVKDFAKVAALLAALAP